jgi:hypothetical protein
MSVRPSATTTTQPTSGFRVAQRDNRVTRIFQGVFIALVITNAIAIRAIFQAPNPTSKIMLIFAIALGLLATRVAYNAISKD